MLFATVGTVQAGAKRWGFAAADSPSRGERPGR
jgi:hypothetical protein